MLSSAASLIMGICVGFFPAARDAKTYPMHARSTKNNVFVIGSCTHTGAAVSRIMPVKMEGKMRATSCMYKQKAEGERNENDRSINQDGENDDDIRTRIIACWKLNRTNRDRDELLPT